MSSRSAFACLIYSKYYDYVYLKYNDEIYCMDDTRSEHLDDSIVFLRETSKNKEESEIICKVVDIWARSSLIMDSICEGNGIEYYQFIQPNQYYSGKKFTTDEMENAVNTESKHAHYIQIGYPGLLEKVPMIRNQGVRLFSAVHVFDEEEASVYIDNCCHFNNLGNRLLASFIADQISEEQP